MGYYPQTVGVFNDTLESNVLMGHFHDPDRLKRVVEDLGLDHLANRLLGESGAFVSGGERQRLQLARLMYASKPVCILDEPLMNLDLMNERLLIEKLASFLAGRSGLIISHKPEVLRLATHLLVLSGGKVAESGTFSSVSNTSAIYRRIIATYLDNAKRIGQEQRENP